MQAEAAFLAQLNELGATLLESTWLGVDSPHRVLCAAGHECAPRPYGLKQGKGICLVCVRRDPKTSEAAFRARLNELGATLLESEWLGVMKPHRVRCAEGHENKPRPISVLHGNGACRTCAGKDPKAAEAAIRTRLEELGATLLEAKWLGTMRSHKVRCAAGHECNPRPNNVQQGTGICPLCKGRAYSVFYVVADNENAAVKFGITSSDGRRRIAAHRSDGYDRVELFINGMSGGDALALERACIAALRDAGEQPVRGREYFHVRALAVILDVAHGWTQGAQAA
jgi:hypothetical protein